MSRSRRGVGEMWNAGKNSDDEVVDKYCECARTCECRAATCI